MDNSVDMSKPEPLRWHVYIPKCGIASFETRASARIFIVEMEARHPGVAPVLLDLEELKKAHGHGLNKPAGTKDIEPSGNDSDGQSDT